MHPSKHSRSGYEARRESELPVLGRWIKKEDAKPDRAPYLDVILYSKEQIQKENAAMNTEDPNKHIDYDYGIISIKPSDVNYETPM